MKVVTVRDFFDHATEICRSADVMLVPADDAPVGFFLPWNTPELPVEVRREVFTHRSGQIGAQLDAKGVSESEVLDDFAVAQVVGERDLTLRPGKDAPTVDRPQDGSFVSHHVR